MTFKFSHPKLSEVAKDALRWAKSYSREEQIARLRKPIKDEVANILLQTPEILLSHEDVQSAFEVLVDGHDGESGEKSQWQELCFGNQDIRKQRGNVYEFLNQQYVSELANYLMKRADMLGLRAPVKILEIWAGNWALSFFVQRELDLRAGKGQFHVVATDSSTWNIPPLFDVRSMGEREALDAFRPDMAMVSWMAPDAVGWINTPSDKPDIGYHIEATSSVHEYVLIGPMHTCGMVGATWNPYIRNCADPGLGKLITADDRLTEEEILMHIPSYDGAFKRFEMREVRELLPFQIWAQHDIARGYGHVDDPEEARWYRSRTVSFSRVN